VLFRSLRRDLLAVRDEARSQSVRVANDGRRRRTLYVDVELGADAPNATYTLSALLRPAA